MYNDYMQQNISLINKKQGNKMNTITTFDFADYNGYQRFINAIKQQNIKLMQEIREEKHNIKEMQRNKEEFISYEPLNVLRERIKKSHQLRELAKKEATRQYEENNCMVNAA